MKDREALIEDLRVAREAIAVAERNLDEALSEVIAAPRSQKVTISQALETAFKKLEEARQSLLALKSAADENSDEAG